MTTPTLTPEDDALRDPVAYEQSCLQQARTALESEGHEMILKLAGERVLDVQLEGHHPGTEVVITIENNPRRSRRRRVCRFAVWGPPELHAIKSEGMLPSPVLFGVNVAGWALES